MRFVLLALCVIFGFAYPANAQGHESSATEAIVCGDPVNAPHCKMYFSGFADTIQMALLLSPAKRGVCDDIPNLLYEFIDEVKTNPKARGEDVEAVLFRLLTRNKGCETVAVTTMTAGQFIDLCKAGDIGFQICSEYRSGVTEALFFIDKKNGPRVLCGDQNLAFNVIPQLNQKLQSNYRLRNQPAVAVIADELGSLMHCPKPPAQ